MDSLLRWSIENSGKGPSEQPSAESSGAPRQPLDPGIIDVILGKSDAVLMKVSYESAEAM